MQSQQVNPRVFILPRVQASRAHHVQNASQGRGLRHMLKADDGRALARDAATASSASRTPIHSMVSRTRLATIGSNELITAVDEVAYLAPGAGPFYDGRRQLSEHPPNIRRTTRRTLRLLGGEVSENGRRGSRGCGRRDILAMYIRCLEL